MTSNQFVAREINRIWLERIERWRERLAGMIAYATMTDYNKQQVKMVVDEIIHIQAVEAMIIDAKPE